MLIAEETPKVSLHSNRETEKLRKRSYRHLMFEDIFSKKTMSPSRMLAYGFEKAGDRYRRTAPIMDGEFRMEMTFDLHGNPDTFLFEGDTGEPYVLYKTPAEGAYVGDVRKAVAAALQEVADACFEASPFRMKQTLELLAYAAEAFGDEPEFLWARTPDCAILRRCDSGKWYVVLMTIPKSKLGIDSEEVVEIADLHATAEEIQAHLKCPAIYPGWHMNKKSWYTVILDGSVENNTLFSLVRESHQLAGKFVKSKT